MFVIVLLADFRTTVALRRTQQALGVRAVAQRFYAAIARNDAGFAACDAVVHPFHFPTGIGTCLTRVRARAARFLTCLHLLGHGVEIVAVHKSTNVT